MSAKFCTTMKTKNQKYLVSVVFLRIRPILKVNSEVYGISTKFVDSRLEIGRGNASGVAVIVNTSYDTQTAVTPV